MMTLRHGHFPAVIREEFQELASQRDQWTSARMMELTGRLWNCTDTVPAGTCDDLDIRKGSSYASACRDFRPFIRTLSSGHR